MQRYVINVPETLQEKLQQMGVHECPEKLKKAQSTQLVFASQVVNQQLRSLANSPLYCYLPTTMTSGFPFLVNGDFLLNADRMQLLDNDWNAFLFKAIAFYHVHFLAELTEHEAYYTRVLNLFTARLPYYLPTWASNGYAWGIKLALKEIAFIPSRNFSFPENLDKLLKYDDAVSDMLGFFTLFKGIDPRYEQGLVLPDLQKQRKLKQLFELKDLIDRLLHYAAKLPTFQEQLLLIRFLFQHQDPKMSPLLSRKAFLLSDKQTFLLPSQLSIPGDCQLTEFPDCLSVSWLHQGVLSLLNEEEISWVKSLGVNPLSNRKLLEKISDIVRDYGGSGLFRRAISLSVEEAKLLFKLLYTIYFKDFDDDFIKGKVPGLPCSFNSFPLLTQDGQLKPANACYLPGYLMPVFDLQAIAPDEPGLFVHDYYGHHYDTEKLKLMMKSLSVKDTVDLHIERGVSGAEYRKADFSKEYRDYLANVDGVNFNLGGRNHISDFAFLDFMRFLRHPDYARHFWQQLCRHADQLIKNCQSVSVSVRSNKYSYEFPATHYLDFMLSRTECVQAENGKYYRANQLYNPHWLAGLDKPLRCLLSPVASRQQFGVELPPDLFSIAGFKSKITIQDYQRLFKVVVENDDPARRQRRMQTLYQWLIKAELSEQDQSLLRASNIHLLAFNGEFQLANHLFYAPKVEQVQWVVCLSHSSLACFIKELPDLGVEGMRHLAELFQLPRLDVKSARVILQSAENNQALRDQVRQFKQLLKYANQFFFYRLPKDKRKGDYRQYYKRFYEQFEQLKVINVQSLFLQWEVDGDPCLALEMLQLENTLYLNAANPRSFEYLIKAAGRFLGFDEVVIEKIFSLSRDPEPVRQERVREEGLDIDEILSVHEALEEVEESFSVSSAFPPDEPTRISQQSTTAFFKGEETQSALSLCLPSIQPDKLDYAKIRFEKADPGLKSSMTSTLITSPNQAPIESKSVKQKKSSMAVPSDEKVVHWSGRWGEAMVWCKLKVHYREKYPDSSFEQTESGFKLAGGNLLSPLEVVWVNQQSESGLPYDFRMIKNGKARYVEVKATYNSSGQNLVRITGAEWNLMRQAGNRYRLFYITKAGSQEAAIQKIKDPAEQIVTGELMPKEIQLKL